MKPGRETDEGKNRGVSTERSTAGTKNDGPNIARACCPPAVATPRTDECLKLLKNCQKNTIYCKKWEEIEKCCPKCHSKIVIM